MSMSTPVASRRWTLQVRTNEESGDVERYAWRARKSAWVARPGRKSIPSNEPAGSWSQRQPPGSVPDGPSV